MAKQLHFGTGGPEYFPGVLITQSLAILTMAGRFTLSFTDTGKC